MDAHIARPQTMPLPNSGRAWLSAMRRGPLKGLPSVAGFSLSCCIGARGHADSVPWACPRVGEGVVLCPEGPLPISGEKSSGDRMAAGRLLACPLEQWPARRHRRHHLGHPLPPGRNLRLRDPAVPVRPRQHLQTDPDRHQANGRGLLDGDSGPRPCRSSQELACTTSFWA